MGKLVNTLSLLGILSNKRKYSIEELSRKLEVSPRMVRYYKEELEKSGFFIDSVPGKYGGYVLVDDIYLPKMSISKYDIELLEGVYKVLDKNNYEYKEKFLDLIDKTKGIYKTSQKKYTESKEWENIPDNKERYNIINDAIKNEYKLEIKYKSLDDKISERIIEPCEIVNHKANLYVAAFCELRGEIRLFEFKRIVSIKKVVH